MATYLQRWQALGEALLGQPATVEQLTRLGEAIAANSPMYSGQPYAEMTNAQKAEFCLKYARQHFIGLVKQHDNRTAMAAAAAAAAAVDVEFEELIPVV